MSSWGHATGQSHCCGLQVNSRYIQKYKHFFYLKIILKNPKQLLDFYLWNTGCGCNLGVLMTAAVLFNNNSKSKNWCLKSNPQLFLQKARFVLHSERAVVLFKSSFNRTARRQGMILKRRSRIQPGACGLLSCSSATLLFGKETASF